MCDYCETADEAKSPNESNNVEKVNITVKGSSEAEITGAEEMEFFSGLDGFAKKASGRIDNVEISGDFTYNPDRVKYKGKENRHYWPDAGRPEKNEEQDGDGEEEGLQSLDGVGREVADALSEAGFETLRDVNDASISDLMEVEGVGLALVSWMKSQVRTMELPEEEDNDESGNEVEVATPSFLEEGTFKVGY
jgi:hypothetical protein